MLVRRARLVAVALTAGALAVASVTSCALSGGGCPCGQIYEQDPFDPASDFFVGADHVESDHCFCRCGDGPEERMPPSATCDGYEGACRTRAGELAQLTCE